MQNPRAWWAYAVHSTVVELRAALAAAKHQQWLETKVLDRYIGLYIRSLSASAVLDLPLLAKVRCSFFLMFGVYGVCGGGG